MTQATELAPQRMTDNTIHTMSMDEFIACKGLNQSSVGKYYIRQDVSQALIAKKIEQLVKTINGERFFLIEKPVTIWINPSDPSDRVVIDGNSRRATAIYVRELDAYSDVKFLDVTYQLYTGELNARDLYRFQEISNNETEGHSYLQRTNAAIVRYDEAYADAMKERYATKAWKVADKSDDIWRGADKHARGVASKAVQSEFNISHTTLSQHKRIAALSEYLIEAIDNNTIDPIGLIAIVSACNDPKKLKDKYTVEAIYAELRQTLKPTQNKISRIACESKIAQLVKELTPPGTENETSPEGEASEGETPPEDTSKKNFINKDDALTHIDKTVGAIAEVVSGKFLSSDKLNDEIGGIYVKCVEILNSTKNTTSIKRKVALMPLLKELMLEFLDSETLGIELDGDELSKLAHKANGLTAVIAKSANILKGVESTSTEVINTGELTPLQTPIVAENAEFKAELTQN